MLQKEVFLPSKVVCYTKILEKIVQNKRQAVFHFIRHENMQEIHGELSLSRLKLRRSKRLENIRKSIRDMWDLL